MALRDVEKGTVLSHLSSCFQSQTLHPLSHSVTSTSDWTALMMLKKMSLQVHPLEGMLYLGKRPTKTFFMHLVGVKSGTMLPLNVSHKSRGKWSIHILSHLWSTGVKLFKDHVVSKQLGIPAHFSPFYILKAPCLPYLILQSPVPWLCHLPSLLHPAPAYRQQPASSDIIAQCANTWTHILPRDMAPPVCLTFQGSFRSLGMITVVVQC